MASIRSCLLAICLVGCDAPNTKVVLDNDYPPATANVIYQAFWQAVSFAKPILPGASSDPENTVAASDNSAYVVLAPGFFGGQPTSLVVLQSSGGFAVHLDETLHIPVDDQHFAGNCAAGSFLTQGQADFITQRVFAGLFAGLGYDAATCAVTGP
jgi:hypothetical protein